MNAGEWLKERGVRELLHFTTNRGALGILAMSYILSRRRLPKEQYLVNVAYPNATIRPEDTDYFDKSEDWLDFVNLSVSEINRSFFDFSKRWHPDEEIWWSIFSLDTGLAGHDGVYFATTNNGYPLCHREAGLGGVQKLFHEVVPRKGAWSASRHGRAAHLPTCQQAEVLYPASISIEAVRRIYTAAPSHSDIVRGWLREFGLTRIEVTLDPNKFHGVPN